MLTTLEYTYSNLGVSNPRRALKISDPLTVLFTGLTADAADHTVFDNLFDLWKTVYGGMSAFLLTGRGMIVVREGGGTNHAWFVVSFPDNGVWAKHGYPRSRGSKVNLFRFET